MTSNVDTLEDDEVIDIQFTISSHGADYSVDFIIDKIDSGEIYIPPFQRKYVWPIRMASRFIESLLIGLPVPAIFLAREKETERFIVVDGQQRLLTLYKYFKNNFNALPVEDLNLTKNPDRKAKFQLRGISERFNGKSIDELDSKDKLRLKNYILHCTIFKQDSPDNNFDSVYLVFERLNTGGRKLTPQEIRSSIFHGEFNNLLGRLGSLPIWEQLGLKDYKSLETNELILRFIALFEGYERYKKPMVSFLNKFMGSKNNIGNNEILIYEKLFTSTIEWVTTGLGKDAFKLKRSFNAALFDSVMVGSARHLKNNPQADPILLRPIVHSLISDSDNYLKWITRSTTDDKFVFDRISAVFNKLQGS